MKPYSFDTSSRDHNTGCCPGHDWPRLYRWSGRYSSKNSHRTDTKCNKMTKRARRRKDKMRLKEEM